jgi:alkylated DNA repair protein alkB homolog 7
MYVCQFSRRYERGHWDAVIVKYKETELFDEESVLSPQSRSALDRIRSHIHERHFDPPTSPVRWLPCHVIDYHANGELNAHVDSVRFSGKTVSGLSLMSPAIMRLRPAPDVEGLDSDSNSYHVTFQTARNDAGHVDLLLPPRSLYVLSRASRYLYTHELLPNNSSFLGSAAPVVRSHRMSVIFRDALTDH